MNKTCKVALFLDHNNDEGTIDVMTSLVRVLKSHGYTSYIIENIVADSIALNLDTAMVLENMVMIKRMQDKISFPDWMNERALLGHQANLEFYKSLKENKVGVEFIAPSSRESYDALEKIVPLKEDPTGQDMRDMLSSLTFNTEANKKLASGIDDFCKQDGDKLVVLMGYYHFGVADLLKQQGHTHLGSFMVLNHNPQKTAQIPVFFNYNASELERIEPDFEMLDDVKNLKFYDRYNNPEVMATEQIQSYLITENMVWSDEL